MKEDQLLLSKQIAPRIGAEVSGLSLAHLTETDFAALIQLWREHLVLVFRDQLLDDNALVAFARRFGDLDKAPPLDTATLHAPAFPEIAVVSNVVENGTPIGGLGHGDLTWHADMTFQEEPPVGCILNARETPSGSGFTFFVSLRAATQDLSDDLRRPVAGRIALHDKSYTSAGTLRQGVDPHADPAQRPGGRHPLVARHPSWDEEILLLGRRRNSYVFGLDHGESEALLDTIWAHATRDDYVMRHEWRPNDVVLWDNLATMHRRDAFASDARRILHRAQIRRLKPAFRVQVQAA